MDMLYRACPICESNIIKNVEKITFHMDGIMPDFYFLAKCSHCGFIYANTPATEEDYDNYYKNNNRYNSLPQQDIYSKNNYESYISLITKYVGKDDSLLDIGCGNGDLLRFLQIDGYKSLTGLDPSNESIRTLNGYDIEGILGSIYDEPKSEYYNKFDVIVLSGVLEHIYNLKNAISNFKRYLKDGGRILCFIPNAIAYHKYPLPLAHYINIEHINHFSPNSIVDLFGKQGFSLLECNTKAIGVGKILDPALLVVFEYTTTDNILSNSIGEILKIYHKKSKGINEVINSLIDDKTKIAIFGTGNYARSMVMNTNVMKAQIEFFVDNDISVQGKDFYGFPVKPPESLKYFDGDILILSMRGYREIEKQLKGLGITNKILTLDNKE